MCWQPVLGQAANLCSIVAARLWLLWLASDLEWAPHTLFGCLRLWSWAWGLALEWYCQSLWGWSLPRFVLRWTHHQHKGSTSLGWLCRFQWILPESQPWIVSSWGRMVCTKLLNFNSSMDQATILPASSGFLKTTWWGSWSWLPLDDFGSRV